MIDFISALVSFGGSGRGSGGDSGVITGVVSGAVTLLIGLPWMIALLCPILAGAGVFFLIDFKTLTKPLITTR